MTNLIIKHLKFMLIEAFQKDELAKLNWVKGHNKIEIIINNQLLKILVNSILPQR